MRAAAARIPAASTRGVPVFSVTHRRAEFVRPFDETEAFKRGDCDALASSPDVRSGSPGVNIAGATVRCANPSVRPPWDSVRLSRPPRVCFALRRRRGDGTRGGEASREDARDAAIVRCRHRRFPAHDSLQLRPEAGPRECDEESAGPDFLDRILTAELALEPPARYPDTPWRDYPKSFLRNMLRDNRCTSPPHLTVRRASLRG